MYAFALPALYFNTAPSFFWSDTPPPFDTFRLGPTTLRFTNALRWQRFYLAGINISNLNYSEDKYEALMAKQRAIVWLRSEEGDWFCRGRYSAWPFTPANMVLPFCMLALWFGLIHPKIRWNKFLWIQKRKKRVLRIFLSIFSFVLNVHQMLHFNASSTMEML